MNTKDDPRVTAWLEFLRGLMTPPMERAELAQQFGVSVRHLPTLLASIDGAEKVGRRWRLPLSSMPPQYALSIEIPQKAQTGKTDASQCCTLPTPEHRE
jgi:hypothetical protein